MKLMTIFRDVILENLKTFDNITVYRAVFVDDVESIDFDNVGVHWTVDPVVADNIEDHMTTLERAGTDKFILKAIIKQSDINLDATVDSNIDHPNEYEIVLNENISIRVDVTNAYGDEVLSNKSSNVGNRSHKWVYTANSHDEDELTELLSGFSEWADVN